MNTLIISNLAASENVIDLRAMVHLMPDQLQSQMQASFWGGAMVAFGICLFLQFAVLIRSISK